MLTIGGVDGICVLGFCWECWGFAKSLESVEEQLDCKFIIWQF